MMLVLRKVVLAHEKVYDRGDIIFGDTSELSMLERREETISIDHLVGVLKDAMLPELTKAVMASLRNSSSTSKVAA